MCCAMSLVCPSIATHHTCQFWACSEPINMPKNNRLSRQMWSVCCYSIPLFRKCDKECCPQVLSFFMTILGRILQQQQRAPEAFSLGSVWSPTIVHSDLAPCDFHLFLHMNQSYLHNELQTSVENWLKAQVASFYDEGIGRLIQRYEKCLRQSIDYVQK